MKVLDGPVTGAAIAPRPVNVDGESSYRILEAYKVWLHREHEQLSRDLYPDDPDPENRFNPDTAAEDFHYAAPGAPPPPRPAARARQVLEAVGAIASGRVPADPDPVFAAIEAHRAAVGRCQAAVDHHRMLMQALPDLRPRAVAGSSERRPESTDTPEWAASEFTVRARYEETQTTAVEILQRPPTTLAGVTALLQYMEELEADACPMPKVASAASGTDRNGRRAQSWAFHARRMAANALEAMAGARACPAGYTPVMRRDGTLAYLTIRQFADLSTASRARIVVINPETCFDQPPRAPTRRRQPVAA